MLRNRRLLIIGAGAAGALALLCAVLAGLALWSLRQIDFLGGAAEDLTRAQVENVARVRLPPGAHDLHSHLDGFQDRIIHARFTIAPAELPQLLASTTCPQPLSTTDTALLSSPGVDRPWWTPERAQRFASCSTQVGSAWQAIFVDMTDPQQYIVYVMTFET